MAGKADRPTFVTKVIHFDYEPTSGELAPPAGRRAMRPAARWRG